MRQIIKAKDTENKLEKRKENINIVKKHRKNEIKQKK